MTSHTARRRRRWDARARSSASRSCRLQQRAEARRRLGAAGRARRRGRPRARATRQSPRSSSSLLCERLERSAEEKRGARRERERLVARVELLQLLPGCRGGDEAHASGPSGGRELLDEDRHTDRAGVDADHARELHHLEDLLARRAVADRVLDVEPQPRRVEMRRGDVERGVDQLLHLRLEHAGHPRDRRELRVRLEEIGVERQDLVPELVPIAALLGEVGLQRELALRELLFDRLARGRELLDKDRHADVAGVDAERRGELEHLHDLRRSRPVRERLLDVLADTGRVQVGRRRVDRDVDELLDLRVERARLPRHRREARVRLEEVLVHVEQRVPERVPVPARLDELVPELLLPIVRLRAHGVSSSA